MSKNTNKLAQLRALEKDAGKNLQYIIDEAYQIWENPIILYDIDLKVLAYAEGDAPFWDDFTHNGMIKQEILELYINEGAYSIITNQRRQVMFLDNEHLKHHVIFGKIYDRDSLPIACIDIVEINKSFMDDDLVTAKFLCKMLSNEICGIPYFHNYSQAKLDYYIGKLIDDEINDKIYASVYVEMIYKSLKDNLYLAVADIAPCDPTYAKLDYYKDLFKQTRPAFRYAIYSNYIVIIASTSEVSFYPKKCFGALHRIFDENNIKVGISSRFENLYNLSRYYHEAIKALNDGWNTNGGQRFFVYNNEICQSN